MKARGREAARAVAEYESFATSLAFLRRQARRGTAGPDFAERERELLHHLWQRKETARPALTFAAQATGRLRPRSAPAAHRPYPHTAYAQPTHPYAGQPYSAPPYANTPYHPLPGPYANPPSHPPHTNPQGHGQQEG